MQLGEKLMYSLLFIQMNNSFGHLDDGITREVADFLWKI